MLIKRIVDKQIVNILINREILGKDIPCDFCYLLNRKYKCINNDKVNCDGFILSLIEVKRIMKELE